MGGLAGWWSARPAPDRPPASRAAPTPPSVADAGAPARSAPSPRQPAPSGARRQAARRPAPPPPVSATAPPGCPEDAEDPPGFVRPAVWELLRLRAQELRDRLPRLSRDASPPLREGLRGLNGPDPGRAVERMAHAPDRVRDGFDVLVAARLHLGMRALGADELREAWHQARAAAAAAPDDPLPHALASLVARRTGEPENARRHMRWAWEAAPDEPALALAHARLAAEHARFGEALEAADAYLASVPDDARIRTWRARLAARRALTAEHARRSGGGVHVSYPEAALSTERVDALIDALREAMAEVAELTHAARRPELAAVIYADRASMRRATCAPSWSGGIFDGVLHLDVPAVRGPRWRRIARHEATHAQLARVRGRIPHWLNEGLAQHLEGAPSGRARAAWRRMVRDRFWIPFASLEGQLLVIDDPGDAELAYHQSLAMVRYLLEVRGRAALGEAVARIERGEHEDLLARLVPGVDGAALLAFLARE